MEISKLTEEQKEQRQKLIDDGAIEEAVNAYIDIVGIDYIDDFEEAYNGHFPSDEEFARDMADNTTAINDKEMQSWPFYCIDWEYASRDLMMDYSEQDGFYFRNL